MSRTALLAAMTLAAIGVIAGAWFFELVLKLAPCPLCLIQRWPWYAAIAIGCLALIVRTSFPAAVPLGLVALALAMIVSAGLGIYHSGIEWSFWQGPVGCSAALAMPADAGGLLEAIGQTRVPSCTEAAWRFLGLSLAGWNIMISLALLAMIAMGLRGKTQTGA
jgi:disulfide bond formation protein DsbB